MQFSTNSLQISLTLNLATFLRSKGYDILWHADKSIETQSAGLETARAVVTLVPDFPDNPAFVVRKQGLNGDAASDEEVVVPAMSLQVPFTPVDLDIIGLGQQERNWERSIRVDGIGADRFQQVELADVLTDWLLEVPYKRFVISDYDTDPAHPVSLDQPACVEKAQIQRKTLPHEVEAVQPYFFATAVLSYIE